jgi:hypothetical protein
MAYTNDELERMKRNLKIHDDELKKDEDLTEVDLDDFEEKIIPVGAWEFDPTVMIQYVAKIPGLKEILTHRTVHIFAGQCHLQCKQYKKVKFHKETILYDKLDDPVPTSRNLYEGEWQMFYDALSEENPLYEAADIKIKKAQFDPDNITIIYDDEELDTSIKCSNCHTPVSGDCTRCPGCNKLLY